MQLSFQMLGSHEKRHPCGEQVFKAIFLNSIQHSLKMPFKNNMIFLPLQRLPCSSSPRQEQASFGTRNAVAHFDKGLWTIFPGRQIRKPSIPAHWCRSPEVCGAPGAGGWLWGISPTHRRPQFQRCQFTAKNGFEKCPSSQMEI